MQELCFSVVKHVAWAPGVDNQEAWAAWAEQPFPFTKQIEPSLPQMAPMLRRRAGFLGKMALQVAYQCLDGQTNVPSIFCSRHGEVSRAVTLLTDLAKNEALSPTSFALAVHNASAGLFSIARNDHANHLALSGSLSSVEHAVVEACGLLADGATTVLLVVYDTKLPDILSAFADCEEQSFAWAWLLAAPNQDGAQLRLRWTAPDNNHHQVATPLPASLQILRFFTSAAPELTHIAGNTCWQWVRDV
jgi:hypothetical protein